MITLKRINELFSYDKDRGILIRKSNGGGASKAGDVAGWITPSGSVDLLIDGKTYRAHRIIWFIEHGHYPKNLIDHINGNPGDNRIENLREATERQNQQNRIKPQKNNKSGYLGVHWNKKDKKFVASIKNCGKKIYIGSFDCPIKAHEEYLKRKRELHEYCTI